MSAKPGFTTRDLALILAVVALWGFSFVAIKVGLREIPPFAMAALRFFFAAFPLVFFIKRPRMPWRFVVAYAFGIGVHFCLGANLARLELQEIFRRLIPRLEAVEPAGPVERMRSSFVGGIKRMPLYCRIRPSP